MSGKIILKQVQNGEELLIGSDYVIISDEAGLASSRSVDAFPSTVTTTEPPPPLQCQSDPSFFSFQYFIIYILDGAESSGRGCRKFTPFRCWGYVQSDQFL